MREFRILSPTAILGYGFPVESLKRGMARRPHAIAVDAGSTDPGPSYLGLGRSFTSHAAVCRDLSLLIPAAARAGVPLIIGTAGGSGARPHVAECLRAVEQVLDECGLRAQLAVIHADVPKGLLTKALRGGRLTPLPFVPPLTPEMLRQTSRVVAQMGLEPLLAALSEPADIVVAGRCYDPAVFAAPPVARGFDTGLALHMGKILECSTIAATPGSGSDCALGVLRADSFRLEPLSPERRFTVQSVAAHTFYEKSHPLLLPGPGGHLDLSQATFTQVTPTAVEVRGSRFVPSERYAVKLEGVRRVGYRTVSLAGVRDRALLDQLDGVLAALRAAVERNSGALDYSLTLRVYGRDGVMGPWEPHPAVVGREVGLVIDVIAPTQPRADAVCGLARSTMLHLGFPGRMSTAGNLAFPFSPADIPVGRVYEFSVYHLLELDDPLALFPVHRMVLGGHGR